VKGPAEESVDEGEWLNAGGGEWNVFVLEKRTCLPGMLGLGYGLD
jgi:hypothetical protein